MKTLDPSSVLGHGERHPRHAWVGARTFAGRVTALWCERCRTVVDVPCLNPWDGDEYYDLLNPFLERHSRCAAAGKGKPSKRVKARSIP